MRNGKVITTVLLLLVMALVTAVSVFKARANKVSQGLTVEVNQLPAENGVVPVEIKQVRTRMDVPSELAELSYVVKNNTNKDITAFSIAFSLTGEKNGKNFIDQHFLTSNTFVHPDVQDIHHSKPISPGQEVTVNPPSTGYRDGSTIKGVILNVDYVEFTDRSVSGPNKNGGRIITLQREGAQRYKNWLVQQYLQSGKSIDAVAALLKAQQIPDEITNSGMYIRQGANVYRKHLLLGYESHGAKGIEKYLNR